MVSRYLLNVECRNVERAWCASMYIVLSECVLHFIHKYAQCRRRKRKKNNENDSQADWICGRFSIDRSFVLPHLDYFVVECLSAFLLINSIPPRRFTSQSCYEDRGQAMNLSEVVQEISDRVSTSMMILRNTENTAWTVAIHIFCFVFEWNVLYSIQYHTYI